MRKGIIVFISVVLFGTLYASGLASPLIITNQAGFDFYEIRFSPADTNSWSGNILDKKVILDHDTETVAWPFAVGELWDLKVTDELGRSFYWRKIEDTEREHLILKMEGNYLFQ